MLIGKHLKKHTDRLIEDNKRANLQLSLETICTSP